MEQFGMIINSIIAFIVGISFFALPIITIFLIFYNNSKTYKEGAYYKITKISFLNVWHNAGRYGEYLTYKYLKSYENIGAKFLFNIYIPKKDEETTEIDVLMISRKGIFVFESKNYSGWIFGTDTQRYWYQTLPAGRGRSHKEKFYNPVFQNNTHVKYLKSLIGDKIPFYSIITFSDRCTLKNVNTNASKVNVINRYKVYSLVSSIYNSIPDDKLTDIQVEEIYNILYPRTQVDETIKQQHVANIHNTLNGNIVNNSYDQLPTLETPINNQIELDNISINKDRIENDLNIATDIKSEQYENNNTINKTTKGDKLFCPLCGSELVLRKAKRGKYVGESFYGCSNYPKCKYIRKIEES